MEQFLKKAKKASKIISQLSSKIKNQILEEMAKALIDNCDYIIKNNNKDLEKARKNNLNSALLDRLVLTGDKVQEMSNALLAISKLKDPTNRVLDGWVNQDGLNIQKVSVPLGVIGVIYESRPDVTSDCAALCFKSGNVVILKGGKEAQNSSVAIVEILQEVLIKNNLAKECISLIPEYTQEGVRKLLKQDKYIDLIIPRGGAGLIEFVSKNSSIPVVKHDKGLCHIFIDKYADFNKARKIAINAKCQRPSVCNAMETLLIHQDIAEEILPLFYEDFTQEKTKLLGCEKTAKIIKVKLANEENFQTEYLTNTLNIKIVKDLDEALLHIARFSSGHSEAIISENYTQIEYFLAQVDSACVYANASTRFTDGSCFELGAEVGISTNKLHARGPMGLNELTSYKFKIYGKGQIRA